MSMFAEPKWGRTIYFILLQGRTMYPFFSGSNSCKDRFFLRVKVVWHSASRWQNGAAFVTPAARSFLLFGIANILFSNSVVHFGRLAAAVLADLFLPFGR